MSRLVTLVLAIVAIIAPRLTAQTFATLRAGDVFDMRLSGMPVEFAQEFTLQYTVGQDGTVNVPLTGLDGTTKLSLTADAPLTTIS